MHEIVKAYETDLVSCLVILTKWLRLIFTGTRTRGSLNFDTLSSPM